jgi:hypothetical protein
MAEIHKGDIGTIFMLTLKDAGVAVDVSDADGANEMQIFFKKPSGKVVTQTAAFGTAGGTGGEDGRIKYTTVAGDLDEVGYWEMQAKVIITAGTFKSEIEGFHVKRNLA